MTTLTPYLTFNGNCKEAFDFYKNVFQVEFNYNGTFGEMPPQEGMPEMSDADKEKIMHISLPISKESTLMGSDTGVGHGTEFAAGNNFSISINTDTNAEADRLYAALSAGGKQIMPMSKTFWESYIGMLTDKFGVNWMVSGNEENK